MLSGILELRITKKMQQGVFYSPPIIGQELIKTKIYLNIKHYDDVNWC
jgi:hypothetical protein